MAIKKYMLILGLLGLFQTASFAQKSDASADYVFDSSNYSSKKLPQFNEFKNNQYPYPPRPKDQWELGLSAGASAIAGDINSKIGFVGGISLRKALSHVFSLRMGYLGSFNSGKPSGFQATYASAYKTQTHDASLDLIASLNTISSHRGNPKANIYVLVGTDVLAAQVKVQNAAGDYHIFHGTGIANVRANTIGGFGGVEAANGTKSWTVVSGFSFGGGIAFKVSNKVNIGIEQRFTKAIAGYDYFDGFRGSRGGADVYSNTTLRLNINVF